MPTTVASGQWVVLSVVLILAGGLASSRGDGGHDDEVASPINSSAAAEKHSLTEAYLYGTLAVAVVSVLSLAGVIVIPFIKQKMVYDGTMLVFLALSVGTMASDALLHLVPETMGLHGHRESDAETRNRSQSIDNDEGRGDKPYLGKMVAVLATLYALYLLEVFAHVASRIVKAVVTVRGRSVRPADTEALNAAEENVAAENGLAVNVVEMRDLANKDGVGGRHGHHGHSHVHGRGHSHGLHTSAVSGTIFGLKPVAFVVVVSDGLHNFADGLAIGAGFAKSLPAGLAVSIAVVCHELPHEVGDFAILLNTGVSVKKALLLNFFSALTCFAGLYPGIVAGQQETLRRWIFAAVAGGFLYVALVHMLRELREYGRLPWYLSMVLQNVGLIVGFVIILLLAIYEDRLGGE